MVSAAAFRVATVLGLIGVGALALAGCNSSGLPAGAAAVEGTVTLNGTPVSEAVVTFRSDTGSAAAGQTDEQGVYRLSSADIPGGVTPGIYQVTVKKMEKVQPGLTEEDPNYRPGQTTTAAPKNLLPEKYARPQTSGLQATVEEGANVVPLELVD